MLTKSEKDMFVLSMGRGLNNNKEGVNSFSIVIILAMAANLKPKARFPLRQLINIPLNYLIYLPFLIFLY